MSNSETLKPIKNILESISFSKKSNSPEFTAPQFSTNGTDTFLSSLAFKIIIVLILLFIGIVGYTYLEKEINQLISDIENYFQTKKYTKKEKKELEERKRQEKIENENTPKQQSTENIIKDLQKDIKKKEKKEPSNYDFPSKLNASPVENKAEEYHKDALQKALDDAAQTGGEVMPDLAQSHGKKGWCFIGADNLSRTCAEIGVNDVCMSGEIFPTKDVCINPNLRA